MKTSESGFIEEAIIIITGVFTLGLIALIVLAPFTKWEISEDNVSGIVYGTTNNGFIAGNTDFKVRASVDTYINEKNESSYCLPPNSPYKALVNEAAADKDIHVRVTTTKGFWWKAPWTCIDNVKVERVK